MWSTTRHKTKCSSNATFSLWGVRRYFSTWQRPLSSTRESRRYPAATSDNRPFLRDLVVLRDPSDSSSSGSPCCAVWTRAHYYRMPVYKEHVCHLGRNSNYGGVWGENSKSCRHWITNVSTHRAGQAKLGTWPTRHWRCHSASPFQEEAGVYLPQLWIPRLYTNGAKRISGNSV